MTLPIAKNIPEIDFNIGGLRSHAILSIFVGEPGLSEAERKIRGWLLHTVFSAARHYSNARELVAQQNDANQQRDGGLVLYLLDVSENIEDCLLVFIDPVWPHEEWLAKANHAGVLLNRIARKLMSSLSFATSSNTCMVKLYLVRRVAAQFQCPCQIKARV